MFKSPISKSPSRRWIEIILYVILWGAVFCIPIIDQYMEVLKDSEKVFSWTPILGSWKELIPFLVLFLVHDLFIASFIIKRHFKTYILLTVLCLAAFRLYNYSREKNWFESEQVEFKQAREGREKAIAYRDSILTSQDTVMIQFLTVQDSLWKDYMETNNSVRELYSSIQDSIRHTFFHRSDSILQTYRNETSSMKVDSAIRIQRGAGGNQRMEMDRRMRPGFFWFPMQVDEIKLIIAILILGMNLAIIFFFHTLKTEEQLQEMEKGKLKSELEYLKYQINPHFFMNTLNNIHALVDFDPEKAQETILELSKLMRYILYESSRDLIPVDKEAEFLRQYISLMRIRFSSNLEIKTNLDEDIHGAEVPPLLLITFVENAFKHGISYKKPSFIHINLTVDEGRLTFTCVNSVQDESKKAEEASGIGLENISKRLQLLYAENHTLDIQKVDDTFQVKLIIPTTHDQMLSR